MQLVLYCKFKNFRKDFIFAKLSGCEVRENHCENVKSLPFTYVGKSCSSRDFLTSQICLLTLFIKIKHLRNVKSLPFTDEGKSCSNHGFLTSQICL